MKELFKFCHFIIIGWFVITGNDLYDKVLNAALGVIGYCYAFRITGGFAFALGYDSFLMSFIHWIVRTIVVLGFIVFLNPLYYQFKSALIFLGQQTSEIASFIICTLGLILLAELLKNVTGLNKKYF